jgi:hypothetical protein
MGLFDAYRIISETKRKPGRFSPVWSRGRFPTWGSGDGHQPAAVFRGVSETRIGKTHRIVEFRIRPLSAPEILAGSGDPPRV